MKEIEVVWHESSEKYICEEVVFSIELFGASFPKIKTGAKPPSVFSERSD